MSKNITVPEDALRRELERLILQRDRAVEALREIEECRYYTDGIAAAALAEIEESG